METKGKHFHWQSIKMSDSRLLFDRRATAAAAGA
jgi:hypothetical protein